MRHVRMPPLLGVSVSLALIVTACGENVTATQAPTPVVVTSAPATPTPPPDPRTSASEYLAAWQSGNYAAMYAQLAQESRASLSAADFEQQYRTLLETFSVNQLTTEITNVVESGEAAQVTAKLRYDTVYVGPLETEINLPLRRESGQWNVIYSPALIWPELVDGNQPLMVPIQPARGNIYDRNGLPLVVETAEAVAVGVVPGEIGDPDGVARSLGQLIGVAPQLIAARYEFAISDQYFPLFEVSAEEFDGYSFLQELPGVQITPYTGRYYYGNGAAAQITGYTRFIQPDEVAAYKARGYFGNERIGVTGLEQWGEPHLAGKSGYQLQLRDAGGQFIHMIAQTSPVPPQDIYSTIDFELQSAAQFALSEFSGAVVVMNLDTGEVLAMASAPTFSPNVFDIGNRNQILLQQMLNDPRRPLLNHAAQSAYPAGSVFKIVTLAAGLTSGLFTPETEYTCTGEWNETSDPTFTRKDWKEGGHGTLTLMQGLSASCNPWFWHIGYALFNKDPNWLSKTAVEMGLGQPTGIEAVEENPGQIPSPGWKQKTHGEAWSAIDGLNLSIGQGDVLVSPLQIARMVAAVGNGGTLYQPQLVTQIRPSGELGAADATLAAPTFQFQPKAVGQLPLTPDQIGEIQIAMRNVVLPPIGTARNRFQGFRICVAGKTGTAEDPGVSGLQEPDAWFAGYTCANRQDKPDIAVAVVVQNAGQGSDYAAPIFRRVIEAYFGLPYVKYPWEESIGVPRLETPTPTPEVGAEATETPTPAP